MVGVVDCLGGGFEVIFSKLAPETVEHEFGGGFASKGFPINLTMLFYILEIRVSVVNLKHWQQSQLILQKQFREREKTAKPGIESTVPMFPVRERGCTQEFGMREFAYQTRRPETSLTTFPHACPI